MTSRYPILTYGWNAQQLGNVAGQTGYAQIAYTGSAVLLSEVGDVIEDESGV